MAIAIFLLKILLILTWILLWVVLFAHVQTLYKKLKSIEGTINSLPKNSLDH